MVATYESTLLLVIFVFAIFIWILILGIYNFWTGYTKEGVMFVVLAVVQLIIGSFCIFNQYQADSLKQNRQIVIKSEVGVDDERIIIEESGKNTFNVVTSENIYHIYFQENSSEIINKKEID